MSNSDTDKQEPEQQEDARQCAGPSPYDLIPILVTTEFRGVFFGYVTRGDGLMPRIPENREITLMNARNCVHWTKEVKGVFGLAANGPVNGCRVGHAVKAIALCGVTSITVCTEAAAERWEAAPWN